MKKDFQSCETLLLKIMTETYDCFLPGRKEQSQEVENNRPFVAVCCALLILLRTGWEIRTNKTTPCLTPGEGWGKLAAVIPGHVCAGCLPTVELLKKTLHAESGARISMQKVFYCTTNLLRTSCV